VKFLHEDPEFSRLVGRVAASSRMMPEAVEKDYWIVHALWALVRTGWEVSFKGGTSLAKAFHLVERFSEDLDLRVDPGSGPALPPVSNWTSEGPKATAQRRAHFEAMAAALSVPGARVALAGDDREVLWRGVEIRVLYPRGQVGAGSGILTPFVRLEIGRARVTPAVQKSISSYLHEEATTAGAWASYVDTRVSSLACVHPLVTLIEKIDALQRRFLRPDLTPVAFVRHYEDAARIVRAEPLLEPLPGGVTCRALATSMLAEHQIRALPRVDHPAFADLDTAQSAHVHAAYRALDPLYWGPRMTLIEAAQTIQAWIRRGWT